MGNEQSGPDGVGPGDAGAAVASSVPSTPRPILRNSAGNFQQQQLQQQLLLAEERNRRSVVFRDLTEDALRFNHSILKGTGSDGLANGVGGSVSGDGGGLARLSQQVNNLNGIIGISRQPAEVAVATAVDEPPRIRLPRAQKPQAPRPPPPEQQQSVPPFPAPSSGAEPQGDERVARMREYVFALAERKEKQDKRELDTAGGRLYDPSVQELPPVAEEKEDAPSRSGSGLFKVDSAEALREEIKQEILSELLQAQKTQVKRTTFPSVAAPTATEEKVTEVTYGKLSEDEKRRLIADIRQQLLGGGPQTAPSVVATESTDGGGGIWGIGIPEADYSEDELPTVTAPIPSTRGRLPRFASQVEIPVVHDATTAIVQANGHYRVPPQVQVQRRYKGPAPAPPNARYRRAAGPPVVREPYQAQWEEPIYAYDGPQTPQEQQQQLEQLEKAYDDRYRQKSRSKRFGDSWKRMTASLSKAFGFAGGAGGGTSGKPGASVGRRSSVRDSTYQRPAELHQREPELPTLGGSRAGSVYSLASVEMPPMPPPPTAMRQPATAPPGGQHQHPQSADITATAAPAADIWRDVAIASHDQMELHANNPVFGVQLPPNGAPASSGSNGLAGIRGGTGSSSSSSSSPSGGAPAPEVKSAPSSVPAFREQTYL